MEETKQINGYSVDGRQTETIAKENEELKNQLTSLVAEMNHFTYIVSHDLQAPLRSITGFLELLEKRYADKLDDNARKYIDFAVKGTARIKGLISDLLEYSRLSTDTSEPNEIDLSEVTKEIVEKLKPVIDVNEAEIIIKELPVVRAKKKQMEQLIHNLLDNALKFRNAGKLVIKIYSKKENGFWTISIEDNGIGIDPEYAEKIFIIFRRLYADETKYIGRGFGLAACKKIVELHGGSISVKSALGQGSTFNFSLPIKANNIF